MVNDAIKGANDVLDKLIGAVAKLAVATGNTDLADANTDSAAAGAEEASVKTFIESVNAIIDTSKKSGVEIRFGTAGGQVTASNQTSAVLGGNAQANAGSKLADEVAKADPWAMIDKIKNAKTSAAQLVGSGDAGELATGGNASNAAGNNGAPLAKTNADLAAAVALKAMTKSGKFSVNGADTEIVKAAVASAVTRY